MEIEDGLGLVAVLCACNKFLVWNNLRINCLTFPTQKKKQQQNKAKTLPNYVCSCVRQTKAIAQVEPKTNFGFVSSCLAPPHIHTYNTHTPNTHHTHTHVTITCQRGQLLIDVTNFPRSFFHLFFFYPVSFFWLRNRQPKKQLLIDLQQQRRTWALHFSSYFRVWWLMMRS